MGKYETEINMDFDELVQRVSDEIYKGSISASIEDASDFTDGDARCSVRVFERYSNAGKNRVSMNVTFFQNGDGPVHVSGITSGGSQAVFFKVNTWGEDSFLYRLKEVLHQIGMQKR